MYKNICRDKHRMYDELNIMKIMSIVTASRKNPNKMFTNRRIYLEIQSIIVQIIRRISGRSNYKCTQILFISFRLHMTNVKLHQYIPVLILYMYWVNIFYQQKNPHEKYRWWGYTTGKILSERDINVIVILVRLFGFKIEVVI